MDFMDKMIEKVDDKLLLVFDENEIEYEDLKNKLNNQERNRGINSTFYLIEKDRFLNDENDDKYIEYEDKICFVIGNLDGEYYKLNKDIFKIDYDFFIEKSLPIDRKMLYKYPNVSIIRTLSKYAKSSIWLENDSKHAENDGKSHIPYKIFKVLLKKFPTPFQMESYKFAEIDKILGDYFDTDDYLSKYEEYLNKHQNIFTKDFFDKQITNFSLAGVIDLERNKLILSELRHLLEIDWKEKEWQTVLLPYIRLLFPKYVYVLDEIGILDYDGNGRRLDYILIDYDGNVDIIELKNPSVELLRNTQYRYNYVESKEIAGTVMQCEKYLVDLTSKREYHENKIKKKLKEKLNIDYEVHINRPQAIIIAGRTCNFSDEQKADFQVIKRKYSNIADILSYDDLINRIEHMIESVVAK